MNCRVIYCAFALVLNAACGAMAEPASAPPKTEISKRKSKVAATSAEIKIDWTRFQTENLTIQNFSSGKGDVRSTYPIFLQTIYTRLLDWEPRVQPLVQGAGESANADCRLSFSSSDLKTEVAEVSQFQKDKPECVFKEGASEALGLKKLLQALSVHFDVSDAKHFRKVIFKLKTENDQPILVRGLLGLHDDKVARPLVIMRLGVHGNVDEFLAERYIGKAAYEDFDYNILVLENLTSHGYLVKDNPITFAGVEEGLHTFQILQMLKQKNSILGALITDVHLFGISLGAHGVFVTTMMDEANQNYLKSVTAYCPMINLHETMNYHSKTSFSEAGVDLWNRMRLRALPDRVEELQHTEWYKTAFDFTPRFMPAILDYLDRTQKRPAIRIQQDVNWPKGFLKHLETSESFFELNNFWPFFENNKTPLLIVTTPNDPLVPVELNADLILQKKQNGRFEKTEVLELDRGVHCALPVEYQWSFIVDLLKAQWR